MLPQKLVGDDVHNCHLSMSLEVEAAYRAIHTGVEMVRRANYDDDGGSGDDDHDDDVEWEAHLQYQR